MRVIVVQNPKRAIMNDKLNDVFNLPSVTIVESSTEVSKTSPDITSDFDTVRGNLHDIIGKGSEALDELIEIAKASQHPRAFEIVGQIIKTLADANKDLMSLHKTKKDIDKDDTKSQTPSITNNSLFVGSTAELSKYLKNNQS